MAATNRKYRFKGNESFILREGWLTKAMTALSSNPKLFAENSGADELGMGVNMAKSLRYWLKCAELTEEKQGIVKLSEIGEAIFRNDPYVEDIFSLWVIHCNIARNREQATVWNLFFHEFEGEEFQSVSLKQEIARLVAGLPDVGKYSEKSVLDDCDALLRMYTKEKDRDKTPEEKNASPFSVLGLIRNINGAYVREQPSLNRLPEEIVWYLMAEGRDDISIDDLLEERNSPGKLLQLKRSGLLEKLERLAERGILDINRTAGLDMVYRKASETRADIIEHYYK